MNIRSFIYNNRIVRKLYRTAIGRFIYHLPQTIKYILFNKNPFIPPMSIVFTGRGDFEKIGQEFFIYFQEYGNITPDSKILDIGCGIGRMAIPFITYLSPRGEYYGFDIVKKGILWCNKKITSKYPNFKFRYVDVYNELYNRKGTILPENFVFPYNDNFFDFIFLTSVFTHMSAQHIIKYVEQIKRVLKPGCRVLLTINLLNNYSRNAILQKKAHLLYKFRGDDHGTIDPKAPDNDIAIDEQWFRQLCQKKDLIIIEPVLYGKWSGRENAVSGQDIVILRNPNKDN